MRRLTAVSDTTITFLVLGAVVVVFVRPAPGRDRRHRDGALAVGDRGARPRAGARGFGDPTVLFIASLFVVSEASTRPG